MNTEHLTHIARPYVAASFEYADAHNALKEWQVFLNAAALVVKNNDIQKLLQSPKVSNDQMVELICEVLSSLLNPAMKNFLKLLGQHQRLAALPAIATLFAEAVAEKNKTVAIDVWSAVPLENDFKTKLTTALEQKLKRKIALADKIDADLIGGILVRAGDVVYDGSVRGKLNRLLHTSLR